MDRSSRLAERAKQWAQRETFPKRQDELLTEEVFVEQRRGPNRANGGKQVLLVAALSAANLPA